MDEIKIWAQMFFDDGSVTRGKRIPAEWLEEEYLWKIEEICKDLLFEVNREEGWVLLWGAGNIEFWNYPAYFEDVSE